jgi:ABC-2 type transport system ATP-binding protein
MVAVIVVEHLVKSYQDVLAVNDVSFSVTQGCCFGLLGPNGAGKTTTIEIMEGIVPPSSGQVNYHGQQASVASLVDIGIQFQHTALQDYLTVRETLELFSSFYPKPLPLTELIALCDLDEFINRDNRLLSGGQRQRLLLALALVNDPGILFLDEPTTGLDPYARRQFWQLIGNIKASGKTIVLTTHYMDEAQQLCDQVVIMDKGKIIEQGEPRQLLQKHFSQVVISLPRSNIQKELTEDYDWRINAEHIDIVTERVEQTVSRLIGDGVPLEGLQVKSANLDDLFLKLTGHPLQPGGE